MKLKTIDNFKINIFTINKKYNVLFENERYTGADVYFANMANIRGAPKFSATFCNEQLPEKLENEIKMHYHNYMGVCENMIEKLIQSKD